MRYSLWSRGRLFGHSDLAYVQWAPWLRAGDFEPSDLGHRLMPVILGVGPALTALHDAAERAWMAERKPGETEPPDDWPASVKTSSEFADAVSLQDEIASLELELRDSDGQVVPTESIWLQDADWLAARGRDEVAIEMLIDQSTDAVDNHDGFDSQDLDELDLELEDDLESWEPAPSRYQILVTLAGADEAIRRYSAGER